jgi:effector-binding domain-containing protein
MSEQATTSYEVTEEIREEMPTITVRVTTTMNMISDDIGRIYHQIFAYLEDAGVQPAGAPFARYHKMSAEEIDMEAGVPLGNPLPGNDQVNPSILPGGPVAVVWYTGPYGEEMAGAYGAIEQWMNDNDRIPTGGPWEVYWTDPAETPSEEYRTEIIWPMTETA